MDQTTHGQYLDYQAAAARVSERMARLGRICDDLGLREYAEALQTLRGRMEGRTFRVGVVGEFKRGKSTVINSLLGEELLPADILPATAAPTYIRWDTRPRAVVHFKDGTEKEIGVGDLPRYVTMLDEESETMSATVEDAAVYCPCGLCRNGVEIVDTPGRNLDRRRDQINEEILPRLDAAVMVIVSGFPFSMSESELIRRLLMSGRLKRLVFLVSKMDTIRRPEERPLVLDQVRRKIQQTVDGVAAVYGTDSEVHRDAQSKLSGIRLFGVSARSALEGRLTGDRKMAEESGFPEFEDALSRLLTEERAALELTGPVNTVAAIAGAARRSIAIRRGALEMAADALHRLTDEAEAVLHDCHKQRAHGAAALRARADALTGRLLPELGAVYDGIEYQLMDYVERAPTPHAGAWHPGGDGEAFQAHLERMKEQLRLSLLEGMGRLLAKLQDQAVRDAGDFLAIAEDIAARLNRTFSCFPSAGLSGRSVTFVPAVSLGSFIGDWEGRGLPETLEDARAAMEMRHIVWMIVPHPVRWYLREAVKSAMNTLRTRRIPDRWLSDIIMNVYRSRLDQIDGEIENTMTIFIRTLEQTAADRRKAERGDAAIHAGLDELEKQLHDIEETIRPVKNKFT